MKFHYILREINTFKISKLGDFHMDTLIIKNKIANLIAFGLNSEIDLSHPAINRIEGKLLDIIEYKRELAKEPKAILKELKKEFGLKIESRRDDRDEGINYKIILSDAECKEMHKLKLVNKTMLFGGKKLGIHAVKAEAAKFFMDSLKWIIVEAAKKQYRQKHLNKVFNDFTADTVKTLPGDIPELEAYQNFVDRLKEDCMLWRNFPVKSISMNEYNALLKQSRVISEFNTAFFKSAIEVINPIVVLNSYRIFYDYLERSMVLDINIKEVLCDGYVNYEVEDSMNLMVMSAPKKAKYIPLEEVNVSDVKDLNMKFARDAMPDITDPPYCRAIESLTEEIQKEDCFKSSQS